MRIARRASTGTVYYNFDDHLGSSRVMGQAGQTTACYDVDFLAFGYEKAYTYSCNSLFKFTGKERDSETGNDNFIARYYGSNLGRFLSPDPAGKAAAKVGNPQSWNRYAYVFNNPLRFVDPLGLWGLSYVDIYRKNRHEIQIVAVKTRPGDNPATLAKQLGFKGKDAEKPAASLTKKFGDSGSVRLANAGG